MKFRVQLVVIVDEENVLNVADQFKSIKGEVTNFGVGPVPTPVPNQVPAQPQQRAAAGAPQMLIPGPPMPQQGMNPFPPRG